MNYGVIGSVGRGPTGLSEDYIREAYGNTSPSARERNNQAKEYIGINRKMTMGKKAIA